MLQSKCHDATVLLKPCSSDVEITPSPGPCSFPNTNSCNRQETLLALARPPSNTELGPQLQPSAPSSYGILIAHAFNSPKEGLSGNAICARIRKNAGVSGDKKNTGWQVAVLLELIQNDNFSPAYARTWKKPFRKLRWHISKAAYDKYSPYKDLKRNPEKWPNPEKEIVVQKPPYELDSTPISRKSVGRSVSSASSSGQSNAAVSVRSNTANSLWNQSTAVGSRFPSQGIDQENCDKLTEWSIEDAQYWPVPPPSIHWEPSKIGEEAQHGIKSSSSDFAVGTFTRGKIMQCACRGIEEKQDYPIQQPSNEAANFEDAANLDQSLKDERIENMDWDQRAAWVRREFTRFKAQRAKHTTSRHFTAADTGTPKELSCKSSLRRKIKRKILDSEPQTELTWPLSPVTIVEENDVIAAIAPSNRRSVDVDLESSATSVPFPPSSPLLSAANEQKLFAVVPITKYAPISYGGQSSGQADQDGVNSQKAGSSSKVNPNWQRQLAQGSELRLNGDDTDDDLIDRSRKRRKRFPPGDDPSPNHSSNGCKFACVYHKFHPQQYGVSNRRYLVCEGTGFKYISELIRHIERTHDRIICIRCLNTLSREDRARHVSTCDVRSRLSQSEKWHRIWRKIFPFASRCPNPCRPQHKQPKSMNFADYALVDFEPFSRQPEPSGLQPGNTNDAIAVLNTTFREHSNRPAMDGQDTPSLSDRSICERSAGPSVSDESTLVEEDGARQCQCNGHAKGKGKASQRQSSAAADLALPVQINIQLLGGRVESLERRLPFIEETIKMLSNLMSSRCPNNSCSRDSAMRLSSIPSNGLSKVTVPNLNLSPYPVDPMPNLNATYQKPCATPAKSRHLFDPPVDLDIHGVDGLGLPDFDEELLGGGMDLTANPTTLFNDEAW